MKTVGIKCAVSKVLTVPEHGVNLPGCQAKPWSGCRILTCNLFRTGFRVLKPVRFFLCKVSAHPAQWGLLVLML